MSLFSTRLVVHEQLVEEEQHGNLKASIVAATIFFF